MLSENIWIKERCKQKERLSHRLMDSLPSNVPLLYYLTIYKYNFSIITRKNTRTIVSNTIIEYFGMIKNNNPKINSSNTNIANLIFWKTLISLLSKLRFLLFIGFVMHKYIKQQKEKAPI